MKELSQIQVAFFEQVQSALYENDDTDLIDHATERMNTMYRLPISEFPSLDNLGEDPVSRLDKFKKTMLEEIDEFDVAAGSSGKTIRQLVAEAQSPDEKLDALVALADWFGDMIVFIQSEALKFGIPLLDALVLIYGSNFTKLGPDGKPIYNENGKFMKGENYVPPEPAIKAVLQDCIHTHDLMKG